MVESKRRIGGWGEGSMSGAAHVSPHMRCGGFKPRVARCRPHMRRAWASVGPLFLGLGLYSVLVSFGGPNGLL